MFVSVSVFVNDCVCDSVPSVEWMCDCCVTECVFVTLLHVFVFVCDRGCVCVTGWVYDSMFLCVTVGLDVCVCVCVTACVSA